MTERILAHEVVADGEVFKLHCASVGRGGELVLEPFSGETSGTLFVEGRIEVWVDASTRSIAWRKADKD